jgi:chromate transporter
LFKLKQYLSQPDFHFRLCFSTDPARANVSLLPAMLGAMSMKHGHYGAGGQILGGFLAVLGINLPGLIFVLFIVPFWDDLKKITRIKHSLSGINAVSVGFIIAAFILLAKPVGFQRIADIIDCCFVFDPELYEG